MRTTPEIDIPPKELVAQAREFVGLNEHDSYQHVGCNIIARLCNEVDRLAALVDEQIQF